MYRCYKFRFLSALPFDHSILFVVFSLPVNDANLGNSDMNQDLNRPRRYLAGTTRMGTNMIKVEFINYLPGPIK